MKVLFLQIEPKAKRFSWQQPGSKNCCRVTGGIFQA